MQIKVLFEDNHLIAVTKPAGMLVQGDATGDSTLADWVKNYIKERYKKPGDVFLGIIHRLDRPVSGVVVFARTSKALTRMNELFKERKVDKTYWAIVMGRPEELEAKLVHYLIKDTEKNKTKAYIKLSNRAAKAKQSELSYKTMGVLGTHTYLEVKPVTGRPHQIRVQLSFIGHPISGDVKYGGEKTQGDASFIYLHCRNLEFIHPVTKAKVKLTAKPAKEQLWRTFELA